MMSPSTAPSQYDEKHRSVLKKIERDRKEAQEVRKNVTPDEYQLRNGKKHTKGKNPYKSVVEDFHRPSRVRLYFGISIQLRSRIGTGSL